jgi:hypothetical protein
LLTPIPIPGDFNHDGTVNAADYVVWRKGLGTTYAQNDYNTWRANFGQTSASAASSAFSPPPSPLDTTVPEPASVITILLAMASFVVIPRHRGMAKNRC